MLVVPDSTTPEGHPLEEIYNSFVVFKSHKNPICPTILAPVVTRPAVAAGLVPCTVTFCPT